MSAIKNMYPERSSIYRAWSTWEKISFRFAFIFFILLQGYKVILLIFNKYIF